MNFTYFCADYLAPNLKNLGRTASVSVGHNDSLMAQFRAPVGAMVVHQFELRFERMAGQTMISIRAGTFERRSAPAREVYRDLCLWLQKSVANNVCAYPPEQRAELMDTLKRACKGSWVKPLQDLTDPPDTDWLPLYAYLRLLRALEIPCMIADRLYISRAKQRQLL